MERAIICSIVMTTHMIIDWPHTWSSMLSAPQTRGDERGTSVSNDANTVFAADTFW